jgi:hypothetical protein
MENMDLFNKTINDQIKRVKEGSNLQFEIGVLQDLKRMAEIGCFTVFTALPNDFEMKLSDLDRKITISCQVPRMMWTGEQRINELLAENERLRLQVEALTTL